MENWNVAGDGGVVTSRGPVNRAWLPGDTIPKKNTDSSHLRGISSSVPPWESVTTTLREVPLMTSKETACINSALLDLADCVETLTGNERKNLVASWRN